LKKSKIEVNRGALAVRERCWREEKKDERNTRRLIITLYVVVRDAASCQNRAFLLAVHFVGKIEEEKGLTGG
jgi:hypothetical protein